MASAQKIIPCLWFNDNADEAVDFYMSIFPRSKLIRRTQYTEAGFEIHKRPAGSTMTIDFEIDGMAITALNGGPIFKLNEATSLQVLCETQEEVDRYWNALSKGGDPAAHQCGWLKDKFGLSWQILPTMLVELGDDSTSEGYKRMTKAMLQMKKLDMAALKKAYDGN